MHAIDTPDKQFKDGNGTSELGTILPAWWLNQIQAELLAVLTAAGIQPNKAKTNQLADAIKQIFSGAVVNNLTSDDTDKPLSAAMGKKLQEETLKKEGNQEISGSTFTVGNRSYPGYRLWSTSGNEGLLIESSGSSNGHKIIIRRHNSGVFESNNIRSFSFPVINGDYTLAPAGLLTNQDLNTLTVPGLYGQNSNTNAQIVRNYPVAKAGSLLVLPSAYGVQQIYSVFDGTDIYARNQNSGGWTAWQKTNVSPAEMQSSVAAVKSEIVNGSPAALDTIRELAAALGNDANFANKVLQQIAGKADKSSTRAGYGITDASEVAVLTGQLNHGGTIPLPPGYREDQCKWLVSMAEDDPNYTSWDISEGGLSKHYYYRCYTSGRTVTAQVYHGSSEQNPNSNYRGWLPGKVNYICIGVK